MRQPDEQPRRRDPRHKAVRWCGDLRAVVDDRGPFEDVEEPKQTEPAKTPVATPHP